MNTPAPFPGHSSALKLARRSTAAPMATPAAAGNEMGGQLAADLEALREREMNLRDYEARLRAWQAQLDDAMVKPPAVAAQAAGGSGVPFPRTASGSPFVSDPTLQAAWEKFHRARALLEAEQNQMRDDRIVLRETELSLKRREAELAQRETALAERERLVMAAIERSPASAVQRLTQAPFEAAKAIFSARK